MAKVEDCPGFETFGADVKAARKAKHLARKTLAEMVGIEWRYLANIENKGTIPSPVSYTHLDVYKRQSFCLALHCSLEFCVFLLLREKAKGFICHKTPPLKRKKAHMSIQCL